jgi:uncharacterized protein YoxC
MMSQLLNFKELKKIIKTVTPYYYVTKFKDKINKLIKKANTFTNDDKKIIYLVSNLNDMHFSVKKLNESTINLSGFIIAYTKKNGDKFTSKKNGKFIVIRSDNVKIHTGDEVLEFDNKKILDIITILINSYKISNYNQILTLGDLQDRTLSLLSHYTPKTIKLKRDTEIITVIVTKTKKEIDFKPIKDQFYKNIQINGEKTFYFSIKGFNIRVINKDAYLQILDYLEANIDSYKNIILDLRKSVGGDGTYVFWLLGAIYGNKMVSYLRDIRNVQSVYKVSLSLIKWFEDRGQHVNVDMIKKGLELNDEYIYDPKVRNKRTVGKPNIQNIKFKGNIVILYDFHCGSACSILLEQLKIIKKEFNINIIFLGTEDAYDTKFTHPYSMLYKNYKLMVPTKYNKYRARNNYETIRPDYYYYDTTYEFIIPTKLIGDLLKPKNSDT